MFYTFRDCKIKINNKEIHANNLSLSYNVNSAPLFYAEEKRIGDNVAAGGIEGNARISYYLTGADPIKSFINDEDSIASGNFGGINFKSGYLRSYSFDAIPNNPVIVNAEISFYTSLSGEFSPSNEKHTGLVPLDFSDMTINGTNIGNINEIKQISYAYSTEIFPVYRSFSGSNGNAEGVIFGKNNITLDIDSSNTNQFLEITGQGASINLYLRDQNTNIVEDFAIEGVIKSKRTNTSSDNNLNFGFSLIQDGLLGRPQINSISPSSAAAGENVFIIGSNFYNVIGVCFNDRDAIFTVSSPNLIIATVPIEAISGPLNVITYGGKSSYENFIFIDGGMGGF